MPKCLGIVFVEFSNNSTCSNSDYGGTCHLRPPFYKTIVAVNYGWSSFRGVKINSYAYMYVGKSMWHFFMVGIWFHNAVTLEETGFVVVLCNYVHNNSIVTVICMYKDVCIDRKLVQYRITGIECQFEWWFAVHGHFTIQIPNFV